MTDDTRKAARAILEDWLAPAAPVEGWLALYESCKCPDNEARCFSDRVFRAFQRLAAEAPADWEAAYAEFRDGPAFPPDTPALRVAFAAGMTYAASPPPAASPQGPSDRPAAATSLEGSTQNQTEAPLELARRCAVHAIFAADNEHRKPSEIKEAIAVLFGASVAAELTLSLVTNAGAADLR